MPTQHTPSKYESAFFQRNAANTYYGQINVSGSDIIFYHDANGVFTADRISVWAALYGLAITGPPPSASYASASTSASYALTASYAMNGGGSGVVPGGSYNISSSYSSASLSASYAKTASYSISSSNALSASWAPSAPSTIAISASYASASTSASYALTASFALNAGIGTVSGYAQTFMFMGG